MVNNMEDHVAIQKGRAPTAPEQKAHTAIRSGELPRVLKERAPYKNQGRKWKSPHCSWRDWMVSGRGSPRSDSNGRAHSRGAPTDPKRESYHSIQIKKGACRG